MARYGLMRILSGIDVTEALVVLYSLRLVLPSCLTATLYDPTLLQARFPNHVEIWKTA
jgi:hypothetical protein